MLRGQLEQVGRHAIAGWVQDVAQQAAPVSVLVAADGMLLGRVMANAFREDLRRAGIGDGRHGFSLAPGAMLRPDRQYVVTVASEITGEALPGSPHVLAPAAGFDAGWRAATAAALGNGGDLAEQVAFLTAQADRLRLLRAAPRAAAGALVVAERPHAALEPALRALGRLGCDAGVMPADAAPDPGAGFPATWWGGWHASVEDALRLQGGGLELVYLQGWSVAARYGCLARHHAPRARLVYAFPGEPVLPGAALRMLLSSADAIVTGSVAEANRLRHWMPECPVHLLPEGATDAALAAAILGR